LQCKHELAKEGKFNAEKCDPRWYNCVHYRLVCNNEYDSFDPTCNDDGSEQSRASGDFESDAASVDGNHALSANNEDGSDGESEDDETPLSSLVVGDSNGVANSGRPKLSYQMLLLQCESLLRLVQRDQKDMWEVHDFIRMHILRKRKGLSLMPSTVASERNGVSEDGPLPGRLHSAPNARNTRRLISRHELRSGVNRRHIPVNRGSGGNDTDHCVQNTKSKKCSFCRSYGHQKKRCPKITCWEAGILADDARNSFIRTLNAAHHFVVEEVPEGYLKCVARGGFPRRGVSGLVLHNKIRVPTGSSVDICVSTTLLMELGEPHEQYQEWPFPLDDLAAFIIQAKGRIVINKMKVAAGQGWQQFGLPPSQPSQLAFSQQSQSEYSQQLSQMGYGLGGQCL
jgi:hypothetical protein